MYTKDIIAPLRLLIICLQTAPNFGRIYTPRTIVSQSVQRIGSVLVVGMLQWTMRRTKEYSGRRYLNMGGRETYV